MVHSEKQTIRKLLIVISDVNRGGLLTSIIQKLHLEQIELNIVIISEFSPEICRELNDLEISCEVWNRSTKSQYLLLFLRSLWMLLRLRPKTIFASGQLATAIIIPASFLTRVKNRIFVRHHSDLHHIEQQSRLRHIRARYIDYLNNTLATKIVAVSLVVQEIMVTQERVKQGKIVVIHNGIDFRAFTTNRKQKSQSLQFSAKTRYPIFGVVSRLTNWKGVEYTALAFCEFLKTHPSAFLLIIGAHGDSYPRVREILSTIDSDSYEFRQQDLAIASTFDCFDAFVHVPTRPNAEAFGLVYLEAIQKNIPSIFSRSGILMEIEDPGANFFMVPYCDSNAILNSMLDIFQRDVVKHDINPEWLKQFSLEVMNSKYFDLLGFSGDMEMNGTIESSQ